MIKQYIKAIQNNLSADLLSKDWEGSIGLGGHCYVASEALYHLLNKSYYPCILTHKEFPKGLSAGQTHWFLKNDKNEILDVTKSQFGKTYIPYELAKHCGFLTKQPSKRCQTLLNRIKL